MKNIKSKLSSQLLLIIFIIISLIWLLIGIFLPRQMTPIYEKNLYNYLRQPLGFVDEDISSVTDQEIGYIYIYGDDTVVSDNFEDVLKTSDLLTALEQMNGKYGKVKIDGKTYYYYKNINQVNENTITKISITNDNYIKTLRTDVIKNFFPIIIITVLFISLILVFWAFGIIRKIEKLKLKVDNIDNDNFNHEVTPNETDEIHSLETAIEDMRVSLKNQEEYRNQMYQNISHDFKTPLTVIKSYLEAVKDGAIDNDVCLKVISEQTDKLEGKVHSLLYLNKLDYIKDVKNKELEVVNILDLINSSIEKFKFRRKEIEFKVEYDKNIKYYGTVDSWEAVIDNLFNNFIRYAQTTIKVTVKKDKIIFYNDGAGIEDELLESIFIPFRKGIKGEFGLGLSIIKKTLNYMDYDISIKNNKKGVSFTITKS